MLTNTNITIYNRKYNATTRLYEYKSTQISNVSWWYDDKSSLQADGIRMQILIRLEYRFQVSQAKHM